MGHVNIAVIDDHRLFLDGISMQIIAIDPSFTVEKFSSPTVFLESLTRGERFDLVICDLVMDVMNGLAFVAAIRAQSQELPILMLSGINTAPPIDEIRRLGANGFVHKSAENTTLKDSIEIILAGGSYFVEGLGDRAFKQIASKHWEEGMYDTKKGTLLPKLGERQIQVLRLIADGASNKIIAQEMAISENTVKSHLKQIFLELGVNKRR